MRKARIIRYWEVIDDIGQTIDNAYSYKRALEIKREYEVEYEKVEEK